MSLDLQKVEWKVPEEQDENELVHVTEDTHKAQPLECNSAKQVELQKLLDFCTYDEVEAKAKMPYPRGGWSPLKMALLGHGW